MAEMTCEETRDLLSGYLERTLPPAELESVSAHVGRCGRCAAEADGLRETMALLKGLPPIQAPPELMARVSAAVRRERRDRSLWRILFVPAHVKIPLEAAAALLLFALVYRMPGGEPGKAAPPAVASRTAAESAPAAVGAPAPARKEPERAKRATARPAARRTEAAPAAEPAPAAPPAEPPPERAVAALPRVHAPPEGLPPATLASTEGKRVDLAVGGPEEPVGKAGRGETAAAQRVFAAPPSRLGRSLPYGREVVLEIAREQAATAEERIAGTAARLGGTRRREPAPVTATPAEAPVVPSVVHVDLPASRAEDFLRDLATIGTIPPGGHPGRIDLPAGPSSEIVAFTVRIRLR